MMDLGLTQVVSKAEKKSALLRQQGPQPLERYQLMCPTIIETSIGNLVCVVVAYTRKIKYPWLCIKLELKQIGFMGLLSMISRIRFPTMSMEEHGRFQPLKKSQYLERLVSTVTHGEYQIQ